MSREPVGGRSGGEVTVWCEAKYNSICSWVLFSTSTEWCRVYSDCFIGDSSEISEGNMSACCSMLQNLPVEASVSWDGEMTVANTPGDRVGWCSWSYDRPQSNGFQRVPEELELGVLILLRPQELGVRLEPELRVRPELTPELGVRLEAGVRPSSWPAPASRRLGVLKSFSPGPEDWRSGLGRAEVLVDSGRGRSREMEDRLSEVEKMAEVPEGRRESGQLRSTNF